MSKFQEKLKIQRQSEDTARAGLRWSTEEESSILNDLSNGKTMTDIALQLQRTEGSIRTRLFTLICKKIDNGDALEAYFCNEYNISSDEIATFRQVRKEREEKMQSRMQNKTKIEFSGNVSQRYMSEDLKYLKKEVDAIKRHIGMR